jgi:two-component system KDP operon response regulator KdpE
MTDAPLPSTRVSDLHPAGTACRIHRPSPVITLIARTVWTPDFEVDLDGRCARYPDGEEVRFTAHQWQVLEVLVRVMPRAVSTARLAEDIFGADAGTEDLDHLGIVVSQLRRKLEPEPGAPRYFPCIDAGTYRFDPNGSGYHRP